MKTKAYQNYPADTSKFLIKNRYFRIVDELLEYAGVKINGDKPWDIIVHNPNLFERVVRDHTLGLGESYMEGWWDCDQLDEFFTRVIRANLEMKLKANKKMLFNLFLAKIINRQSKRRAFQVGIAHYDLGNELFSKMLDKRMVYSCAYWKDAESLEEAQARKLELICKKLHLESGMKVLDIGSGWGSFVKYAVENYDVSCVGVTISKQQKQYTDRICKGLPVEIYLKDYRDINGEFDRIVSVGMVEHVGYKNYRQFMQVAHRSLVDDGLFLLHTIGSNISTQNINEWVDKYIFPNGMLPSLKQLSEAAEGLFVIEDLHNFGAHYDRTLMNWYRNFKANWDDLKNKYDDRFYRMWKYYLLSSAGAFRSRSAQLWQLVMSKNGIIGGYNPVY